MDYEQLLEAHGIKPTANRIIIAKALHHAEDALSMKELEYSILSLDKSSIFRVLTLFREHHLVHAIEGGDGSVRYELCMSHDEVLDDDEHVHFFCEQCRRTICLHDTPRPQVDLPAGFEQHSANFLVRGLCPSCSRSSK